jgi:hypothetical protein
MPELLLSKRLLVWTLLTAAALAAVARPAAAAEADTPPVLAVPNDMTYRLKDNDSVVRMTWKLGVQDDTDPHPRTRCSRRSGSIFKLGTTKVTCTATDVAGNRATDSFSITVTRNVATRAATPRLSAKAYRRTAKGVELLGVKVTGVARGATVTVTCAPHCPGALGATTRHASPSNTVDLSGLFRAVHLKAGTTVRVRTDGMASRIVIRAKRPPLVMR